MCAVAMETYKQEFVEFMIRSQVLQFGDFVTKSGRKTPFFINTGRYKTGGELARLGRFYAQAIVNQLGADYDVLFGPAYKGIPLVVTTAMALAQHHGHDVGFCFNRKEAKDHGEGGVLIGQPLRDGHRVVIVEDVITAGTSVRETVPILQAAAKVAIAGLVISVDRMERGTGELNALAEVRQTLGAPAFAIVTIDEVTAWLRGRTIDDRVVLDDEIYARVQQYRRDYGGRPA
jgi:orotate phosphoribosyltransferase